MKRHMLVILFAALFSFQHISFAHEGHIHEEHHHEDSVKYTCIVGDYMTSSVVKAMKAIWQDYPFLKDRVTFEIISKTDLESGFNPNEILDSNLILFDVHGVRISTPTQSGFDFEVLKEVGRLRRCLLRRILVGSLRLTHPLRYCIISLPGHSKLLSSFPVSRTGHASPQPYENSKVIFTTHANFCFINNPQMLNERFLVNEWYNATKYFDDVILCLILDPLNNNTKKFF